MRTLLHSLKAWLILGLITGLGFPAVVWLFAVLAFPQQAGGSLVIRDGRAVGSRLIAQKTTSDRYVHPRPSAGDYATTPSAASNAGWTDKALRHRLEGLPRTPEDLSRSASGLDPDISPDSALWQLRRVAQVRGWNESGLRQAEEWVAAHTQGGIISPAYVNVLQLNLAIDLIPAGR